VILVREHESNHVPSLRLHYLQRAGPQRTLSCAPHASGISRSELTAAPFSIDLKSSSPSPASDPGRRNIGRNVDGGRSASELVSWSSVRDQELPMACSLSGSVVTQPGGSLQTSRPPRARNSSVPAEPRFPVPGAVGESNSGGAPPVVTQSGLAMMAAVYSAPLSHRSGPPGSTHSLGEP
jgi:hypothetical protein